MRKESAVPPDEAVAALLLLALLVAVVGLAAPDAGGGPLAATTAVAVTCAALLAPAIARGPAAWNLLALLLALPALAAARFGHAGALPFLGCSLLVAAAAASGAAGRALRDTAAGAFYLPSILLLLAAPYGLAYLVAEMGGAAPSEPWRLLSPLAAAAHLAQGGAIPVPAVLLLFAWPVVALARMGRRRA